MSFAQSLKDYLFHGTRNKENNPSNANAPTVLANKKKPATICQKTKPSLRPAVCNLPQYNIDQNLTVVGQEIKDLGLSKKLNAHKVKKVLAFDKNPQDLKKDSSKEKLPVQATMKLTQKGSSMPYLGKNGTKQAPYWDPKKNASETALDGSSEEQLSTEEHSANSPAIVVEAPSEKLTGRADEKWAKEVEAKDQRNKMVRIYAKDIIQTLKEKDAKSKISYCLENHKISSSLRAKMVDWMIEVLCSYKCSNQTFFLAVRIMDAYFKKSQASHSTSDLHAVGVTSMFIASKFEEIYPMRLSILYEKVGHKKLSIEEIKQKEGEILSVLGFNLVHVTAYEFVTNVLFQLGLKETMTKDLYDYLQRVCVYLSKANMYDYELISQYSSCELAACTLFVAFKVTEQVDSTFPVATMVDAVCEILGVEDETLYTCATKILNLAKNFEKLFPSFKNLKKFHSIGAPGKNNTTEDPVATNNTTSTPTA